MARVHKKDEASVRKLTTCFTASNIRKKYKTFNM